MPRGLKIVRWQAKALSLVDCVQDTYSNVAALIDDSVYNMEGGMEADLEKMMLDLTRVDPRVTTIVAGVRSLSMTFKVLLSVPVSSPNLWLSFVAFVFVRSTAAWERFRDGDHSRFTYVAKISRQVDVIMRTVCVQRERVETGSGHMGK